MDIYTLFIIITIIALAMIAGFAVGIGFACVRLRRELAPAWPMSRVVAAVIGGSGPREPDQ